MQSYKENVLVNTDLGTIDELATKIKKSEKETDSHIIGKIPLKGSIITVNNLRFKITFSSSVDGCFKARILKPKY